MKLFSVWRALAVLLAAAAMLTPRAALAQAVVAISVSVTESLAFGKFVAGSGGSLLIEPNGTRSATGGVYALPSSVSGPARFEVSGEPNRTFAITLPASNTVELRHASGASMLLSDFASSPASTGTLTLNALGKQTLAVGARLNVGASQPAGAYSGSFVVYADYN